MKAALDISKNIIAAIRQAATVVIPQFCESIIKEKGGKSHIWKRILQVEDLRKFHVEDTTVIIKGKKENVLPEQVLAKSAFLQSNRENNILPDTLRKSWRRAESHWS